jgi:hypothetical protein
MSFLLYEFSTLWSICHACEQASKQALQAADQATLTQLLKALKQLHKALTQQLLNHDVTVTPPYQPSAGLIGMFVCMYE